jgi:hypothetical protein
MSKPKENNQFRHHLTPKQVEALRFALFSQAAQAMGKRIEQLKLDPSDSAPDYIQAIRSEWVVH